MRGTVTSSEALCSSWKMGAFLYSSNHFDFNQSNNIYMHYSTVYLSTSELKCVQYFYVSFLRFAQEQLIQAKRNYIDMTAIFNIPSSFITMGTPTETSFESKLKSAENFLLLIVFQINMLWKIVILFEIFQQRTTINEFR